MPPRHVTLIIASKNTYRHFFTLEFVEVQAIPVSNTMQPKLKGLTKHSLSFDGIPPLEDELWNSGHHLVAISHWCTPLSEKRPRFLPHNGRGRKLGSSASVDWWIYAPNLWGSRGSLPVVWQGWTWKPLQQKYDTKCTQNLSLCQAPKRNIGNCVANVWCCLTISEALKNDTSWHHGFFWNFQVTILKLLKYLDLPFLPRVGTQFPKCLASSI